MSKRRKPGDIVRRRPGSGFCGADEPSLIRVPTGKAYEYSCIRDGDGEWCVNHGGEAAPCMLDCGDEDCREWANLLIVEGPHKGSYLCHISECEMVDRDA